MNVLARLRSWWHWRCELKRLRLDLEAKEGLLWALREVSEVRSAAPAGATVEIAKLVIDARERLAEALRLSELRQMVRADGGAVMAIELDAQGIRLGARRCQAMNGSTACRREDHSDENHQFYMLRENCPHGFYNCKRCKWELGIPARATKPEGENR